MSTNHNPTLRLAALVGIGPEHPVFGHAFTTAHLMCCGRGWRKEGNYLYCMHCGSQIEEEVKSCTLPSPLLDTPEAEQVWLAPMLQWLRKNKDKYSFSIESAEYVNAVVGNAQSTSHSCRHEVWPAIRAAASMACPQVREALEGEG